MNHITETAVLSLLDGVLSTSDYNQTVQVIFLN